MATAKNKIASGTAGSPKDSLPPQSTVSKAELDAKAMAGRRARARAEAIKARVFEFEKTNNSRLVVYASTNGWWKMGGNSALMYVHRIAPRLKGGNVPKLVNDSDFYHTFATGVVSFKDIEALERRLKTLKIYAVRHERDYVSFDLGYKLTDSELKALHEIQKTRESKMNQIVLPKVAHPELYAKIKWLHAEMFALVQKMPAVKRELIGHLMLELTRGMILNYYRLANGEQSEREGLTVIAHNAQELNYELKESIEVKVLELKRALRLANDIVEIKTLAQKELDKLGRK